MTETPSLYVTKLRNVLADIQQAVSIAQIIIISIINVLIVFADNSLTELRFIYPSGLSITLNYRMM